MQCISWNTKLVAVLLCYRVTKSPQTVPVLRQTNLSGSIYCIIITCNSILFFHLLLFQARDFLPSVFPCTLLNALRTSVIAVTCSTKSPSLFLSNWWQTEFFNVYVNCAVIRKHSKLTDSTGDIFPNFQNDDGVPLNSWDYDFVLWYLKLCK